MASCGEGRRDDDECCPITLVPFRTITPERTTFLPCCHRFDSDAIRHYIDNCLARRASQGTTPPVPCPVCRCRVPPDYLADMGIPVAWPLRAPVAAVAPSVGDGAAIPTRSQTVQRRSSRAARPAVPTVIVIDDTDSSEEAHERTAQWIDSSGDDDDEDDEDDSTGSLDDFIVDDDETDPDADYVPEATPDQGARSSAGTTDVGVATSPSGPHSTENDADDGGSNNENDGDEDNDDNADDSCTCSTEEYDDDDSECSCLSDD